MLFASQNLTARARYEASSSPLESKWVVDVELPDGEEFTVDARPLLGFHPSEPELSAERALDLILSTLDYEGLDWER